MLISHRYKFIYLKSIKTAGTSVEATLDQFCVPENHPRAKAAQHSTPQIVSGSGIIGARGKKNTASAEWYNHMPAADVRRKIGNKIWDEYYKFCNIRNPWDRIVSHFHFDVREAKDLNRKAIFDAFRNWAVVNKKAYSDFSIYSINKFPAMDDYISYATLERDFARICNHLGLPTKCLLTLKTGFRGKEKIPFQEYYDDHTRDVVAQRCSREIEHFGWTFD